MKKSPILAIALLLVACSGFQAIPTPTVGPAVTYATLPALTSLSSQASTPLPTDAETPSLSPSTTKADNFSSPTSTPNFQPGRPFNLTGLHMVDGNVGWAIETFGNITQDLNGEPIEPGGHILRTEDGGATWRDVNPPAGTYTAKEFFALDANTAWAVLKGPNLWRTSDGGQTWQPADVLPAHVFYWSYHPDSIFFVNLTTGWFTWHDTSTPHTKRYFLGKATEGGKILDAQDLDLSMCFNFYGPVFVNEQIGYLGGDSFCAFNQTDVSTTPSDFINGTASPELRKTIDGGTTWKDFLLPRLNPIPPELQAMPETLQALAKKENQPDLANSGLYCGVNALVRILPQGIGVRVGCRILVGNQTFTYFYLSPDDGQSWHSFLATGTEYFLNTSTGWRLNTPGGNQSTQLQRTADGGLSWQAVKTVTWQTANFDFVSDLNGWAIVSDGTNTALVRTFDGGKTWIELKPVVSNP